LSWKKAQDLVTPQSSLVYNVYYSTSDNINSVTDAETMGMAWTGNPGTDIASATINGLTQDTQYWFNVVVDDVAGNQDHYMAITDTTYLSQNIQVLDDALSSITELTTYDFSSVYSWESPKQFTFSVTNSGDYTLTLSDPLAGTSYVNIVSTSYPGSSSFSIVTQPLEAIDPGTTSDFIIEFDNTSMDGATYTADIRIESDDPDNPAFDFTVSAFADWC
jgi:hypothetical protein